MKKPKKKKTHGPWKMPGTYEEGPASAWLSNSDNNVKQQDRDAYFQYLW